MSDRNQTANQDWMPIIVGGVSACAVMAIVLLVAMVPGWIQDRAAAARVFGHNPMSIMVLGTWPSLGVGYLVTMALTFMRIRTSYIVLVGACFIVLCFSLMGWSMGCYFVCGAFGDRC